MKRDLRSPNKIFAKAQLALESSERLGRERVGQVAATRCGSIRGRQRPKPTRGGGGQTHASFKTLRRRRCWSNSTVTSKPLEAQLTAYESELLEEQKSQFEETRGTDRELCHRPRPRDGVVVHANRVQQSRRQRGIRGRSWSNGARTTSVDLDYPIHRRCRLECKINESRITLIQREGMAAKDFSRRHPGNGIERTRNEGEPIRGTE